MRYSNTIRRGAISAFILFHVVAIVCWSVPLNTLLFTAVDKRVATYMNWSGLYQSWGLFAPNPTNFNCRLDAETTYRDGRASTWRFPAPQDFGYVRRYFKERIRKWANDSLRMDANAALWPDAALYIARANNDGANPPVTVKLIRKCAAIAPPESSQAEPWQQDVFFVYSVKPGDLQ